MLNALICNEIITADNLSERNMKFDTISINLKDKNYRRHFVLWIVMVVLLILCGIFMGVDPFKLGLRIIFGLLVLPLGLTILLA